MTDSTEAAGHVQTLASLLNQLSVLRLNDATLSSSNPISPDQIRLIHTHLQKFSQAIAASETQDALAAAGKSEKEDENDIILEREDESRIRAKRRRIDQPSESGDRPNLPSNQQSLQPIPPEDVDADQLTPETLPSLVRSINNDQELPSLHVWLLDKTKKQFADHLILASKVPNILRAYIKLQLDGERYSLRGVVVVGPREKKLPHSHSDFEVFRRISQFFSGLLSEKPDIPLRTLISLIGSYNNLFSESCIICGKVLSVEGHHLPPVQRLWEPASVSQPKEATTSAGRWVPRHSSCRTC